MDFSHSRVVQFIFSAFRHKLKNAMRSVSLSIYTQVLKGGGGERDIKHTPIWSVWAFS